MRSQGFTLFELGQCWYYSASLGWHQPIREQMASLYLQQSSREQLLGQSRFVLERLSREIRAAVPNSLRHRLGNDYECLELVRYQGSGRYRELPRRCTVPVSYGCCQSDLQLELKWWSMVVGSARNLRPIL